MHFPVSSELFLSGVKRPSGFADIAPRTCAAGNFVDNIALVFFSKTELRSQELLLEYFYWFISDLYVMASEQTCYWFCDAFNLMYGRVANPRVRGGSNHLKNIPTSSSGVGTGGENLFVLSMSAMRFTGYPLDSNAE